MLHKTTETALTLPFLFAYQIFRQRKENVSTFTELLANPVRQGRTRRVHSVIISKSLIFAANTMDPYIGVIKQEKEEKKKKKKRRMQYSHFFGTRIMQ